MSGAHRVARASSRRKMTFTNARYRPNLDRVVNHDPERERRSLIDWFPFRLEATILTTPPSVSSESPARFEPILTDRCLIAWSEGLE